MNFEKIIDDRTTLMTDMLRKMNIENIMMKSHSHKNFLMIASFMRINTLTNTIVVIN